MRRTPYSLDKVHRPFEPSRVDRLTGWDLVESLYFVIITLTSVGYGDYVPEGEALRLFTSAYIVLGVGILGTALGEVVSSLLSVDATPVGRLLAWLAGGEQTKGEGGEDGASPPSESSAEDLLAGSGDAQGNLLRTLATVAATIGVGSIAFKLLEPGVSWIDAVCPARRLRPAVAAHRACAMPPPTCGLVHRCRSPHPPRRGSSTIRW